MHDAFSRRSPIGRMLVILAAGAVCGLPAARGDQPATATAPPAKAAAPAAADPRVAAVRAASADYAARFNERDVEKLGGHWTSRAELVEGRGRLVGRDAIVGSIKAWLERHPQAQLAIDVTRVEFPADTLARVVGRMTFTSRPGARPVVSRFVSLRVLEDGAWRIAESVVAPSQAAVLDELEWLLGSWQNDPEADGESVEVTFSRSLGDASIVGRTKIRPKEGREREVLQVIHADRLSGQVRTWIFDSSGARAEGVVEADGPAYHQSLVGTPAETAGGDVARWVQVIAPGGDGRFTLHAIERSLDGVPLPDGRPMHFRKVK